jgi:hypothetical protein|uniref:Uncharacterized protein n=1 Tax=Myoviridae sp. ctshb19 TaxID=2825194 RepID=A0A8S5UH16_9CAUD|nr:MAG TPA: hypothetical protein [Myoviridae sp. ctshb19]
MALALEKKYPAPLRDVLELKNGAHFILPHYGLCADYENMLDNHIFNLLDFGPVEYSEQAVQKLDALVRSTFKNLVVERVVQTYRPPRPKWPGKSKRPPVEEPRNSIRVYFRERNARPKRYSASWPLPGAQDGTAGQPQIES